MCNACSKLTGSQYYHDGFLDQTGPPESFGTVYRSPCNDFGHDTHTASKVVWSEVNLVNVQGWKSHTAKVGHLLLD